MKTDPPARPPGSAAPTEKYPITAKPWPLSWFLFLLVLLLVLLNLIRKKTGRRSIIVWGLRIVSWCWRAKTKHKAASGSPLSLSRCGLFAILKPKNRKTEAERQLAHCLHGKFPNDWRSHAGAKPREEKTNRPQYRTRLAIVAVVSQKEGCSIIGLGATVVLGLTSFHLTPLNSDTRSMSQRSIHTRNTQRESPLAFACGIQALLPTSTHSNGSCIIRVCIDDDVIYVQYDPSTLSFRFSAPVLVLV